MVIEPLDDFWGELVSFEFPGGVESGFWLGDRVDGNDASGVDEVSDLVVGVEDAPTSSTAYGSDVRDAISASLKADGMALKNSSAPFSRYDPPE